LRLAVRGVNVAACVGAIAGIAIALTACGHPETPEGASATRSGVVTTVAGGETCKGRVGQNLGQNDASLDFYRQQYETGLANPLEDKLKAYDSAAGSGDAHLVGSAAAALDVDIRADARLVDVPRLYGCYDQHVLTGLQDATAAFATTLDALSCAGAGTCNGKPPDVPGLIGQAQPQERSYIRAIDAYAAQFGGEQLPLPRAVAVPRSRRM
jgi:hypothetical protein